MTSSPDTDTWLPTQINVICSDQLSQTGYTEHKGSSTKLSKLYIYLRVIEPDKSPSKLLFQFSCVDGKSKVEITNPGRVYMKSELYGTNAKNEIYWQTVLRGIKVIH